MTRIIMGLAIVITACFAPGHAMAEQCAHKAIERRRAARRFWSSTAGRVPLGVVAQGEGLPQARRTLRRVAARQFLEAYSRVRPASRLRCRRDAVQGLFFRADWKSYCGERPTLRLTERRDSVPPDRNSTGGKRWRWALSASATWACPWPGG